MPINFGPKFINFENSPEEKDIDYKSGDMSLNSNTGKLFMYRNNKWNEIESADEILNHEAWKQAGISLYELNKMLMSAIPVVEDFTQAEMVLTGFHEVKDKSKYLLLCKDISYYTFFEKKGLFSAFDNFAEAVLECVKNVGTLLDVEVSEDGEVVEIWVRTEKKENLCMYLMDAEPFCVSFGG